MPSFTTDSTALASIHRTVSPMPIGRTPGFLSKAISRQARRGEINFGSTYEVQILLQPWLRNDIDHWMPL